MSSDWTSTNLLFVVVLVGFEVDLFSLSSSVSNWVRRLALTVIINSVQSSMTSYTSPVVLLIFLNTVPCMRPSIFTLLPNSKSYAEVKLPVSPEKAKDPILVAINKRNNLNSYVVNYDSQWEAVHVLIHAWS